MITDDILELFKSKFPEIPTDELTLEDVNSSYSLFTDYAENTQKEMEKLIGNQNSIIKTQILALNSLALFCDERKPNTNKVLSKDYQAKDFHLSASLINISNTANAILELCNRGFNTQAEILFRTLSERVLQTIVLFHNNDDFLNWSKAHETDESKQAHYDIFAKKERLHKKHEEIERLLLEKSFDGIALRNYRKTKLNEYSMSVHGAYITVVMGSSTFLGDEGKEEVNSALFGQPCKSSLKIISATAFELWYFIILLRKLLLNVHNWKPDYKNDLIMSFDVYRFASHKLFEQIELGDYELSET